MTKAVMLSKSLVGIPCPHDPSMQDLFYKLELQGDLTVTRLAQPTGLMSHGVRRYKVELQREGKIKLTAIRVTFYECLYNLWQKIEAELVRERLYGRPT